MSIRCARAPHSFELMWRALTPPRVQSQSQVPHESSHLLPLFLAAVALLVQLDHADADADEIRLSHAP
jgi:hypothetical protein